MLTRPWSVAVKRDRSPEARRRWQLDTYAMGFRSRARGGESNPGVNLDSRCGVLLLPHLDCCWG